MLLSTPVAVEPPTTLALVFLDHEVGHPGSLCRGRCCSCRSSCCGGDWSVAILSREVVVVVVE